MAKRKITRRRRSKSLSAAPRRKGTRRRRRSLSQNIPILGNIGLNNPVIGGAVGAAIGMFLKNQIPDSIMGKESAPGLLNNLKPYMKGAILLGGALVAKHYKQPEIAAGLAAVGTVLTLQTLNVPGLAENFKPAKYADPRLLMEPAYLSENIYPAYMPMYETAFLSQR